MTAGRFASIEDLVRRIGLRRDELMTLADIGALNAFTNERRSALWQVERAVRPSGELFRDPGPGIGDPEGSVPGSGGSGNPRFPDTDPGPDPDPDPLSPS